MHRINFPLISFIVGILTISGLLMVNYYLENAMGMDPDGNTSKITVTPVITTTITLSPGITINPLPTQNPGLTNTPIPSISTPTPTTTPRVTQPAEPTTTPGAQNVQVIVSFLPTGSYLLCPQGSMTTINAIISQTEAALVPVDSTHTACLSPLEVAFQNCTIGCGGSLTCLNTCDRTYTPQIQACDNTYDFQRAALVGPATSQLKSYCTYFDPPLPLY